VERIGTVTRVLATLTLALATMSAEAHADPARDPAAADELFNRGKELLQAGDWVQACAKFRGSMELDPSIGTLLKIAKCHEHEGKLALALHDYRAALVMNRQKVDQTEPRRTALDEFTRNALAQLEPRVPKVHIVVAERPAGLHMSRDGQELPMAALEEELPADPGTLTIVAEAPGYEAETRTVLLTEGQTAEVRIALRASPSGAGGWGSSPLPEGEASARAPAGPVSRPPPSSTQRVLGFASGGAGVVALGLAGWFGLQTLSKVNDSSPYCDASGRCQRPGADLRDQARGTQTISLVLLGVGAALVGTGIVLIATSPRAGKRPVAAGVAPAGAFVIGAF
jgi:hypothetical protein